MGLIEHGIRWALNHIPRPLMQRTAGAFVPLLGAFYAGSGRECPICGTRRRKFMPYGYVKSRKDALCPGCLSLERHRTLWLYLQRETKLLEEQPVLLHIAPEVCLKHRFERAYGEGGHADRYITADLESPLAKMHFDVQEIPLPDQSVDVIICNHLLEHVDDDRRALKELYRIMRHGGWGIVLSPVDEGREHTFEDASVTSPQERTRLFGQYDHRRVYGRDYAQRLAEAGFVPETLNYAASLSPEEVETFALDDKPIYIVRRP